MRRLVLLLAVMALALVLASGGVLAVNRIGTNGPDTLKGTNGADSLLGKGGNDDLFGLGGRDNLLGGDGKDWVLGGNEQRLLGGDNNLVGGSGNDGVQSGRGSDSVLGGSGNDFVTGDNGSHNVVGEEGMDLVDGGQGSDHVVGGSDPDLLVGGPSAILPRMTPPAAETATTRSLAIPDSRRGTKCLAVVASTGWPRTPKTWSRPTASRLEEAPPLERNSTNTSKRQGSSRTSSGVWHLSPKYSGYLSGRGVRLRLR